MLQAFAIAFREGLLAFLVIGLMLAAFARAHDTRLRTATRWCVVIAIFTSLAAGSLFALADNQAVWEGALALLAAVAAVGLVILFRHRDVLARASTALELLIVGLVTLLFITRGGMEIALLLGTMIWQVPAPEVMFAVVAGALLATAATWLTSRVARRLPAPLFQQLTTIFLVILFAVLIVEGIHEISEANVLSGSDRVHLATEPYSTDGRYGQYSAYLLVAVPLAGWLIALFWGHGKAPDGRVAHVEP